MDIGEPLSESELCPPRLLAEQEAAFLRDVQRIHERSSEFLKVSCPACLSFECEHALEKFGFDYRTCLSCGTLYMSPRPSPAILADYYANSENYRIWADKIFPASEAARRDKICRPWLQRILAYCSELDVARGTLIEVGSGFGTFAQFVGESQAFRRVVAIEPTPELADACRRRGVAVVEKRVEDLALGDAPQADVLVAFEVIEHLFDPSEFLLASLRALKDDGLLVLSCPNGEGFDISMLGAGALAVDAEHMNLFNPRAMEVLLGRCGYSLVDCATPGRLDAEFVREAALAGEVELDPFLQRILVTDWDRLGWSFQQFLAEAGLSSHMWIVARKAT